MRKTLFWIHLVLGVAAGVVILVMSLTGVLLGFERQIIAWADQRANRPVAASTQALPMEAALRNVEPPPAAVTLYRDPTRAIEASQGRERTVFVDPYSGAVVGEGSRSARELFAAVTAWHRWLGASGNARASMRSVTGASNLVFVLILVTGPILWIPARWRWQNIRPALLFGRGLKGKARDWNWHNVAGIWLFVPLAVVAASGVVISYPWASNLVFQLAGEAPPQAGGRPPGGPQGERKRGGENPWTGIDALMDVAKRQNPEWRSITARPAGGPNVAFAIDAGTGGQPQQRGQLTVDRRSGEVVRWEPFAANSTGRRWRSWVRFLHTGEALGWMGQLLATLASAAGALLVWTGLALSWRRFRAWRGRVARQQQLAVERA